MARKPNRPSPVPAAFGAVLRRLREAKGISQEALALEAGLDRTFVSQIERGVRQPTLTSLFALAKAVGTPPDKLLYQVSKSLKGGG